MTVQLISVSKRSPWFSLTYNTVDTITTMSCLLQASGVISMMTSSNGNIFRVTGPLCGEFTGPGEFPTQMPVARSFDVFFDLRLNNRLSKHSWGWWFKTLSWSLWRHHNESACVTIWRQLQIRFWDASPRASVQKQQPMVFPFCSH